MPTIRSRLGTRRTAALLLAGGTLAACASGTGRPTTGAGARDAAATVLVFNIHAGKDADGVDNLARVAALVREVNADVVLLQEVDRGTRRSGGVDQPATLARLTGYSAAFGRSLVYDGGEYGIALLSRWPVRGDSVVPLPITPPQRRSGGSYEPRVAHLVRIDAPGGPLAVVNTHLDASADDGYRRQEIRTLVALAASARAAGGAVLVGGDLNSEPGSAVQDAARDGGLRDAWLLCGQGDGLTYPVGAGVKRIDYLYLPPEASCDEARVVRSAASDHNPLVVKVRLKRG